jgi:hypothetical protein
MNEHCDTLITRQYRKKGQIAKNTNYLKVSERLHVEKERKQAENGYTHINCQLVKNVIILLLS